MSPEDQAFIDAQGGAGGTQVTLSPGDEAFIRDALKAQGGGAGAASPPVIVPGQPPAPWNLADTLAQGATLGAYASGLAFARSALYGTPYSMERGRLASGEEAMQDRSADTSPLGRAGRLASDDHWGDGPRARVRRCASGSAARGDVPRRGEGCTGDPLAPAGGGGGAAQGVGANELQMGLTGQSPLEAAKSGAGIGAVLGPAGELASYGLKSTIAPAVASMAQKFSDLGVPLKSGQIPGGPLMTKPFAHASADQVSQWNQALSHTIGEDSASLSNGLLFGPQGAARRVGDTMESITAGHSIPISQPILSATQNLRQQALSDLATKPAAQARVLQHLR